MSVYLRILACLSFLLIPVSSEALTYYWIGGSGNWSDINHWSAVSGGTVMQLHTITPTSSDDVVIDAGSFPATGGTITVNVLSAFCRSFTVVNTPANSRINILSNNSLRVFGDFSVSGGFIRQGNGIISFESSILNRVVQAPRLNFGRVNFSSSRVLG